MPNVKLDTDVLRECGRNLRHVRAELENAGRIEDLYADAVGHPKLSDQVRSFVGNWDDTRAEILGALADLGEAGIAIADSFDSVEASLVSSLVRAPGER